MKPQLYLIWSEEHLAWWKANKHEYTRSIFWAGRFSQEEACEIVKRANAFLDPKRDQILNEIAIPDPLQHDYEN
jgi:hypothetical protein